MGNRCIYLVRHGRASGHGDDAALTEFGRRQMVSVANEIKKLGGTPAKIFVSPVGRSLDSVREMIGVFGDGVEIEQVDDLQSSEIDVAKYAGELTEHNTVFVGHLPALRAFLQFVMPTKEQAPFPEGHFVRLEL